MLGVYASVDENGKPNGPLYCGASAWHPELRGRVEAVTLAPGDRPAHCAHCGGLLTEVQLTPEGMEYVESAIADYLLYGIGDLDTLLEWANEWPGLRYPAVDWAAWALSEALRGAPAESRERRGDIVAALLRTVQEAEASDILAAKLEGHVLGRARHLLR